MRKTTLAVLGAAIALVLGAGYAAAQEARLGVVDFEKVFADYGKVAESQKEFDAFRTSRQAEVEKKAQEAEKEIKPLQEKLDKQGKALSKEASDKIKADIDEKRGAVLQLQRDLIAELQKKNRELVEMRVNEIKEAIGKLAREKGISLVVIKEVAIYNTEAIDITAQVLDALNKPAAAEKK